MTREELKKEAEDYIADFKHEWYTPSQGVANGMADLIARQDAYIDKLHDRLNAVHKRLDLLIPDIR